MQKVETERSTVYLVNEHELSGLKKCGRQMRAQCPVHHSRDRDLVLAPYNASGYLSEEDEQLAGIGHCKSIKCGAIVRVIEWNPDAASRLLGRKIVAGEPRHSITSEDEDKAEEWQQRELASLNKICDTAVSALHHSRCLAYLASRGLGSDDALVLLERLGVGYIPPSEDWKKAPPFELLKWCDRIIFPFTTRSGERGYIGRTLLIWTPGMDENEHKRLLNEHDARMEEEYGLDAGKHQIRRWRKTYRSGFFNASALKEHRHIILTEGTFDTIPLMLAGLVNVIAIAGTELDIEWLREEKKVMEVTLALDSDTSGKKSIEKIIDRINETGITTNTCIPPDDGKGKDWSERYRLSGIDGLDPILYPAREPDEKLIGNPDQQDPIANRGDTANPPASVGVPEDDQADYQRYCKAEQLLSELYANGLSLVYGVDGCVVWTPGLEPFRERIMERDTELRDILNVPRKVEHPVIEEVCRLFDAQVEMLSPDFSIEEYKRTVLQERRRAMVNWNLKRAPLQLWLTTYWVEHGHMPDPATVERKKEEVRA